MAKFVLDNAFVSIDSNDISSSVQSVTVNGTAAEVECTAMGNAGIARLSGLKDWTMDITLVQDFVDDGLDEDLFGIWSAGTGVTCIAAPEGGTESASNPKYTGVGILFEYTPIDGTVGDLATTTITLSGSDGNILARDITP